MRRFEREFHSVIGKFCCTKGLLGICGIPLVKYCIFSVCMCVGVDISGTRKRATSTEQGQGMKNFVVY